MADRRLENNQKGHEGRIIQSSLATVSALVFPLSELDPVEGYVIRSDMI